MIYKIISHRLNRPLKPIIPLHNFILIKINHSGLINDNRLQLAKLLLLLSFKIIKPYQQFNTDQRICLHLIHNVLHLLPRRTGSLQFAYFPLIHTNMSRQIYSHRTSKGKEYTQNASEVQAKCIQYTQRTFLAASQLLPHLST